MEKKKNSVTAAEYVNSPKYKEILRKSLSKTKVFTEDGPQTPIKTEKTSRSGKVVLAELIAKKRNEEIAKEREASKNRKAAKEKADG